MNRATPQMRSIAKRLMVFEAAAAGLTGAAFPVTGKTSHAVQTAVGFMVLAAAACHGEPSPQTAAAASETGSPGAPQAAGGRHVASGESHLKRV